MTDTEIDALEAVAKAAQDETEGVWDVCGEGKAISSYIVAANPSTVLELIQELRQAKEERDWLADMTTKACNHQNGCPFIFWDCKIEGDSCSNICLTNWLEAAKESVCQK